VWFETDVGDGKLLFAQHANAGAQYHSCRTRRQPSFRRHPCRHASRCSSVWNGYIVIPPPEVPRVVHLLPFVALPPCCATGFSESSQEAELCYNG